MLSTMETKQQRDLIIKMAKKKNVPLEKSTVNNLRELIICIIELGDINPTQVELANMLGLSKSSISGILKKAKEIGVIEIKTLSKFSYKTARNTYTLLDTEVTHVIRNSIIKYTK